MELKRHSDEDDEPPGRRRSYAVQRDKTIDVPQDIQDTLPLFSSPFPLSDIVDRPRQVNIQKRLVHRFPVGPRTDLFRKSFYQGVPNEQWNDWRWQMRNRIRSLDRLGAILQLSDDERTAIERHSGTLPVSITPYYASLLEPDDSNQPLRRSVVPVTDEYLQVPGEAVDPLGEDDDSPVPGLIHRYPDRVLFLVTTVCATHCRYCTRSRMVGCEQKQTNIVKQWETAIEYIAATPAVRDVLISGGDPLTMADEKIAWLLSRLRAIRHVEIIRIGTKAPVVMPQRITPALASILKRFHPFWMSIHFTHPDELTPEVEKACTRLADAGIPLGSQTVLLSGINDDVVTMTKLMQGLLKIRVKPYYLYQCDPIVGSSHFRTSVEKGLTVMKGLRGHTTGYAVPTYVIDAPGGGGKIPLLPEYFLGRDGDDLLLRSYDGNTYRYPDPAGGRRAATAPR